MANGLVNIRDRCIPWYITFPSSIGAGSYCDHYNRDLAACSMPTTSEGWVETAHCQ